MTAPAVGARWFPALAEPHVRLYLFGQTGSMLGAWVLDISLNLLVWQLTASPAVLGLLNFLLYVPGIVVTPLFSARLTPANAKRRTLQVTLAVLAVALTLTVLQAGGWLTLPLLMGLAVCRGAFSGMEMPSRQMLLTCSLHDPHMLSSAVALNTVAFHAARMCGPAIAGLLFHSVGPVWGFALCTLALVVMLGCIWHLPEATAAPDAPHHADARGGLRGALDFVRGDRFSRLFLPVALFVALTAGAFQTLVPVLADRVFGDSARWSTPFFSAAGAGGLLAAVLLSTHWMHGAQKRLLVALPWAIGLALAGLGLGRHPLIAMVCFAVVGFGTSFVGTCTNVVMHQRVPASARGGLIALFLMTWVGAVPLAQLVAGLLSQWSSVQACCLILSTCLLLSLVVLMVPRWRKLGRLEWNAERM